MKPFLVAGRRRRTTSVLIVVSATLSAAGCSTGDSGPNVVDANVTSIAPTMVNDITVSPLETWGAGRALSAMSAADGSISVVTTTGVFQAAAGNLEEVQLDAFEPGVQIGATALSADASTLVVSTVSPPTLDVYDVASATPVGSWPLPPDVIIRSVGIDAPTGRIIIDTTAGPFVAPDRSTAPRRLIEEPAGQTARLPDGTLVTPITGSADVIVTRADTGERLTIALPDGATVLDARSSPNGAVVALTVGIGPDPIDRQDQIVLLDATTFEQMAVIEAGRAVEAGQWNITDSAVVITDGPTLRAWTLAGQPISGASPVTSSVSSLHPIGAGLLSLHADGALVRWSADPWTPTVVRQGGNEIEHIEVDVSGATATVVDRLGLVTTWSLVDGTPIVSDGRFATGEATGVTVDAGGQRIGVGSSTGTVTVLDDALTEMWASPVGESPVRIDAIAFNEATGALASGLAERRSESSFDDTVTVWDPTAGTARFSVGGEGEDVPGCSFFYGRVRFSHDGSKIAVTSHDFSVFVLDAETGAVLHEFPGTTTVLDLAFSADDALLVATYDNAMVNAWATSDYSQAASYLGAQGGYFAIAMLPGASAMAVTDITGSISVVDVVTGAPITTFADATFRTATLAVSSDGALLAAPVEGGGIGIWSTVTGRRLGVANGHTAPVTGLAFSPSGDWLASSSSDGTVRTWGVANTSG